MEQKSKTALPDECKHEIDPNTVEFDERFGRRGVCLCCGKKLVRMQPANLNRGKVHMSKKERKRMKANRAGTGK